MTSPRELRELYRQGHNITALLRRQHGVEANTPGIIEMAYDLQAGSYIAALDNPAAAELKARHTAEIAQLMFRLGEPTSILEAGVGEATTLAGVVHHLARGTAALGFDLSWSRVATARRWLDEQALGQVTLFTATLAEIPLGDNSVDIVYTSHSIEPNGGAEEPILRELHRVAARYLVLLEPDYDLASDEGRRRMEAHGYCRHLAALARSLGWQVVEHTPWPHVANPLNPTALTVIRKGEVAPADAPRLVCPRFKTPIEPRGGMLFSPEALVVYPIVGGIPCLRVENGVVASRYDELVGRATSIPPGGPAAPASN